jgi:hypothetical protein
MRQLALSDERFRALRMKQLPEQPSYPLNVNGDRSADVATVVSEALTVGDELSGRL